VVPPSYIPTLHAWLSYDIKFHTKAASNLLLSWNDRDLDLWLEHFHGTAVQPNHWPYSHCSSTVHYLNSCPFHSSPANAHGRTSTSYGGGQSTPTIIQQRPTTNTCRDFNKNNCFRTNCTGVSTAAGPTQARASCLKVARPPLYDCSFSNANYVSDHPDKVFVR